jgi:hypothetical protein
MIHDEGRRVLGVIGTSPLLSSLWFKGSSFVCLKNFSEDHYRSDSVLIFSLVELLFVLSFSIAF